MKSNLDKWIKDARDDAPDSGEYRRLNRAMLKERMDAMGTNRRRNHRVLLGVLSLVILMLFSGQVNQLGSNGFDTTTSTTILPLSGGTVTVHENAFRGGEVNLLEDFSESDIDEFHRSVAAGEGEMVKVSGTSYGGKTNWVKLVRRVINGKENLSGEIVQDPKPESPRDIDEFIKAHNNDLRTRSKSEPPHGEMRMVIDGILVDFKFWTFEYTGYGEVTRYLGTPINKNSP